MFKIFSHFLARRNIRLLEQDSSLVVHVVVHVHVLSQFVRMHKDVLLGQLDLSFDLLLGFLLNCLRYSINIRRVIRR
jgi:hypothetical protein